MKLSELAASLGLDPKEAFIAWAIRFASGQMMDGLEFFSGDKWDDDTSEGGDVWLIAHGLPFHPDFQRELTTAEAAEICGCGKSSIRQWHRQGEINPVRVQRRPELAGRHGGSPAYYWKHGEVAGLAIKHGAYKPPKKGATDG